MDMEKVFNNGVGSDCAKCGREGTVVKGKCASDDCPSREVVELKVGDIVEHTSIYYSSRTSFYKIASFNKSGKKATLKELGTKQFDGDWMNGNVTADTEQVGSTAHEVMVKGVDWKGQQMLRGRINHTILNEDGTVKWVNTGSLENFYKWDGQPIWNNCD